MATITPANPSVPMAVTHYFVDKFNVVQQAAANFPYPIQHATGYTLVSTAGTTALSANAGLFYGIVVITAGTNSSISILDGSTVIVPVTTNTAVGSVATGYPAGLGIRANTPPFSVVVAGTAVSTVAVLTA